MKRLFNIKIALCLLLAGLLCGFAGNVKQNRFKGSSQYYQYTCIFCIDLIVGVDHPLAQWPVEEGRCVMLANGQSNAAQYFDSIYTPIHPNNQFQFLGIDGTLRQFKEKVFGAAAPPLVGSLWGKLGDDLIDNGLCVNVVWLLTAIGGTSIEQWSSLGVYGQNIVTHIRRMNDLGISITASTLMQGETNTALGTSQAVYFAQASDMIKMTRNAGFSGPWYIATETYVKVGGIPLTSAAVQAAQAQLVSASTVSDVRKAGPYLDDLGDPYRFDLSGDYTHFNGGLGRDTVSQRWIDAFIAGGGLLNFILKRDLNPAANDNSPMWINQAA